MTGSSDERTPDVSPAQLQAMRRALGTRLRLCRQAAGLRQADLAGLTSYDRTSVGHIEAGRQHAGQAFWASADAALDAGGALLAAFHELTQAGAALRQAAAAAHRAAAGRELAVIDGRFQSSTGESSGLEEPGDRSAVDASPAAATLRWLVRPTSTSVAKTGPAHRVGPADVARLLAARAQLKAMDDSLGGGAAYGMAHDHLRRLAEPLLSGCYSDAVGRELYGVLAQLTLDLGWMAYDAGRHMVARRHMLRALELARTGQQRLFGGRVLSALSHQALHLGRVTEALDLTTAALAGTKRLAPPAVMAMFLAMQACALAARGDRTDCEAALSNAEQTLAKAGAADDVPGWLDFDYGGLAGHAARAYRDLALPQAAQRFAETAVAQCHTTHSRTRAQRNAILATALARTGDLDAAAVVAEQVVTDAWQLRSMHVITEVAGLVRVIDPSRSSSTVRFAQAARELLAAQPPTSGTIRR